MNGNTNDFLNSFLASNEGEKGGGFVNLPFPEFDDGSKDETPTAVAEPPQPNEVVQAPVSQPNATQTMFDAALAQTPAAPQSEETKAATSFEELVAQAERQRDNEIINNLASKDAIFQYISV